VEPAELIPLSVLELDVDPPSSGGWGAVLAAYGIPVLVDDIGRSAVTPRADARRLITERRESAGSGKQRNGRRSSSTSSGAHS
jgi:hypothetical protein